MTEIDSKKVGLSGLPFFSLHQKVQRVFRSAEPNQQADGGAPENQAYSNSKSDSNSNSKSLSVTLPNNEWPSIMYFAGESCKAAGEAQRRMEN